MIVNVDQVTYIIVQGDHFFLNYVIRIHIFPKLLSTTDEVLS